MEAISSLYCNHSGNCFYRPFGWHIPWSWSRNYCRIIEELPELLTEIKSYLVEDGVVIFTVPKGLSSNAFPDGTNLHVTLMETKEWNELFDQYFDDHILIHHGKK